MIDKIDIKIKRLIEIKNSEFIYKNSELNADLCYLIGRLYQLEADILKNKKNHEDITNQFFSAKYSVNRYYRDSGLDEVADIYNEVLEIAKDYL